ncbi:MAG: acyl-CoA/acyl-ACP dehydrogenase [Deltaproteobacteria bacterium]|nr:acyl-CoA/acyl-ACP dehydrogenase [Deltaproteobacteria bacterium]
MDFGLSEEQEMLQETVRGFVENECPPTKLREIFDGGSGFEPGIWKDLVEMGIGGLVVPEEHGGAEMEVLDLALVAEVLGQGAVPGPFLGHSLACLALIEGGSEEQKREWLPKLASGELVGSVALGEQADCWEPAQWTCSVKDGALHGVKRYAPVADLADLTLVGCAGGDLAIVERAAAGVTLESMDGVDRTRPIFELRLDGAPCELLEEGKAAAGRVRDAGRILLAADSFGAGQKLVQLCADYSKEREQFGMVIAQFQAVKHQIARLATDLEPTRALFWYAAYTYDHIPEEAERSAAIAKAHICDRTLLAAREAVELHGGIGFTWECDVQMWFKRAMFNRAFLGTPEALRERCAALGAW